MALGELHGNHEHLEWLRHYLPELQARNVRTIGLERSAYQNIFLWAYADGTLERELGSKSAAQDYLSAVFVANFRSDFRANAEASAALTIAALDAGIRVVAYDSRYTFANAIAKYQKGLDRLVNLTHEAGTGDTSAYWNQLRHSSSKRHNISHNEELASAWMLGEVEWLLAKKPEYHRRFNAIEALIEAGHKKIASDCLRSDALSACVFDSLAVPQGNRMTMIGFSHLDGVGEGSLNTNPIQYVCGTFADHLGTVQQAYLSPYPPRVVSAVIAGAGMAKDIRNKTNYTLGPFYGNVPVVTKPPIPIITIDTGEINPLSLKPCRASRQIPLQDKFPYKPDPLMKVFMKEPKIRSLAEAYTTAHINPLLMPDISRAHGAVVAAMNPEREGQNR